MALTVLLDGLSFPEAPRWHDRRLWFSDFYRHEVVAVDAEGTRTTEVEVPAQPSGLGWLPDGRLLVVSMLDRRVLVVGDGGPPAEHADLSAYATGPCNDMVVDAEGRAYVGNFGFDRHRGEEPRTAALVRVDPDGATAVAADDLEFPNGTVITPDGATLIAAETFGHRLTAWDRAPDGALSGRRVWADLGSSYPDGICLDAEGLVWVADPGGHEVLRVAEGGEVAERVATGDDRSAYACVLGGDDRRTLFVCTNTGSGPAAAERRDGRIESARVEVPGAGWP